MLTNKDVAIWFCHLKDLIMLIFICHFPGIMIFVTCIIQSQTEQFVILPPNYMVHKIGQLTLPLTGLNVEYDI